MAITHETEEERWAYNCEDCVRTRECGEVESRNVREMGLQSPEAFQQRMFHPVLRAMTRGIRVDHAAKKTLIKELGEEMARRQAFFKEVLGHELNPRSPVQMAKLFYHDLAQPAIMTRGKKGVPGHITCDDEALMKIAAREPLLRPLVNAIADVRTIGVLKSTFAEADAGPDGRMRSSYNICGAATFRLSSSTDAFGSGCNLQNIPSDKSKMQGKAAARGTEFKLPNIRKLYIPDEGMTFFDLDLDRADLQVVVWEADDAMLKTALRSGVDIHILNAFVLSMKEPPPLDELVETHPCYADHRARLKHPREFAKVFCHGTNYGGSSRTMAAHTGRTVHEVDRAQKLWFDAHPGIRKWHERTRLQINTKRYVENRFGYRWYIFDRLDMALNEALAWTPQSTVACAINRAWMNLYDNLPEVEVLLQVHDSLAGQFPTARAAELTDKIKKESLITIPYDDPLVIPVGIKTSVESWGACV